MGAECIISGVRPQIAQTIVHLGIDLLRNYRCVLAGTNRAQLLQSGDSVSLRRLFAYVQPGPGSPGGAGCNSSLLPPSLVT